MAHEQEVRRIVSSFEAEKRDMEAEAKLSVSNTESLKEDIKKKLEAERDAEVCHNSIVSVG